MPKASQVLAGLKRDGWIEVRRTRSHRTLQKGRRLATWAYHDGWDLGNAQMNLRVEYLYDSESRNWSFVVPALDIIGGADSREDAERRAIEAIEFALWSHAQEPTPEGSEIGYLAVTIERPTAAGRRAG